MTAVTTSPRDSGSPTASVEVLPKHLVLEHAGAVMRFHHVWLRDNCGCAQCRVIESGERALFTASIPDDIAVRHAHADAETGLLAVEFTDGHSARYGFSWLHEHDYSSGSRSGPEPILWDAGLAQVPSFSHAEVVGTTAGQVAYLEAVRDYGVALITETPCETGEVERFASFIGHLRETAFDRIHEVRFDPDGYNVAHTARELKPHTDLPGYQWPPSIQLLHVLTNEAIGGETVLVDGWSVLAELRRRDAEAFALLTGIPLTFSLFNDREVIQGTAPMVLLDPAGNVRLFRFSNQLAHPIDASFDDMDAFYRAYRLLGRLLDSAEHQVSFRAKAGDLITVHGHRVLHGRRSFDPTTGARWLQDAYLEYDDLMDRLLVLQGRHIPSSPDR
ncbi:MAG: TauD/TfdA family dioxygenase [Actinomycetales bacterium]